MELRLSSGHTVYRLVIIGSLQIVNARHFLQSWKQVVGVGKLSVYFDSSGWLFPLLSPLSCFPWLSSLMEASLKRVGINKICMLFFLANDSMKTSSTFKFGLSQRWALGNITCLILGAGWSLPPSPHSERPGGFPFRYSHVAFRWGSSAHKLWVSAWAWQNLVKWIRESELFILLPYPAVHIKFLLCLWGILPAVSIIDFLALWGVSVCVSVCMHVSCASV